MTTSLNVEPIRTIRLYGVLGATFGREYRLSVASPKEAIRALSVIVPGFERFLNTSKQRGLTYAVFSGKRNLLNDELSMDRSTEEIRIAPVIIGSKRAGVFQTILGGCPCRCCCVRHGRGRDRDWWYRFCWWMGSRGGDWGINGDRRRSPDAFSTDYRASQQAISR